MQLVNHIRQHRARVELTQDQLAKATGVSRQTIISIEKGKFVPSTRLAFQIARALGMKVDDLFELEVDEDEDRDGLGGIR